MGYTYASSVPFPPDLYFKHSRRGLALRDCRRTLRLLRTGPSRLRITLIARAAGPVQIASDARAIDQADVASIKQQVKKAGYLALTKEEFVQKISDFYMYHTG
ncbi:MAG: hypothetical protein ACLP6Z_07765, partial [Steroidobacteraceae bacterium]